VALDGPSTLQLFASANYLLPLDKYAQQYGWEQRFNEFAYDTEKRDGKLMGVPAAHETTVVYYNKKMFEDNGWQVPQNYNDLVQLSEKIKAKSIIPFAFGSSDFKQANEWWLSLAYNETLGADQFKKVLTGELAWNSPQMVEATQKMVDMWQKGYIYKDSAAITIDDASNLFLTGKAAMKMEGTWLISNLLTKKPSFDWGMFMMPSWKDGVEANFPLAIGGAFGINVNTKHPDEAAAFLDWMNSKELAVKDLQFGNFDSVNGVDINSAQNLDQHVKDAYKLLDDAIAGNKTGYAAWTYWPPKTETYAWSNIESVYMNQMTVKDYLDNLQKNFEQDKKDDNLFKFGDK
jgi:raffinose/stachyose/melibiose transport system substrate-binding protein